MGNDAVQVARMSNDAVQVVPGSYLVGSHAHEVVLALRRRTHETWTPCESCEGDGILAAALAGGRAPALYWERLTSMKDAWGRLARDTVVNHLRGAEVFVVKSRLDGLLARPRDGAFYPETRVLRTANDCVLFLRAVAAATAAAVLRVYDEGDPGTRPAGDRPDPPAGDAAGDRRLVDACARVVGGGGGRVGDEAWTELFRAGDRAAAIAAGFGPRRAATREVARAALDALRRRAPRAYDATSRLDLWMLKADGRSNGRGVSVARSLGDVVGHVAARVGSLAADATVAQRYLDRPLLDERGCKVDFRVWVLVTSADPLVVYGYGDGYARHATRPWSAAPEDDAREALRRHTTNQRNNDVVAQTSARVFVDARRGAGFYAAAVEPRFRSVCLDVLRRARLSRVGRGFEMFGFDFLLRDDFDPWLLEVNASPVLAPRTDVTRAMIPAMLDDLFALLLDEPPLPALSGRRHRPDLYARGGGVSGEPEARDAWHLWACDDGDDVLPPEPPAKEEPPAEARERDWLRAALER